MRTEATPAAAESQPAPAALSLHNQRVAALAVETAKRMGWSADRQRALREAASLHHREAHPLGGGLLRDLVREVWGYRDADAGDARPGPAELATMLELCCFYVQRWEFLPYELATSEQILMELRGMARDGYFPPEYLEALAKVPTVPLDSVQSVVAKLPVFPAVALRAMQLSADPDASTYHLEEVIGSDAVLAGEVLHVSNSPLYAPALPIRSIRQAVLHLGLGECCRVITAAAFRPIFRSPLVRPLWNHSLEVARITETLARTAECCDPGEAFLCGLMHDVGRLAIWRLPLREANQYSALLSEGCEPMFAETLLCGFDHTVAGGEVMCHWKLSMALREAVLHHHQPERTESPLASLLYLAEHCSDAQEDLPSYARLREAMRRTGVSQTQVNALHLTPASSGW